jgi:hypothetical protein
MVDALYYRCQARSSIKEVVVEYEAVIGLEVHALEGWDVVDYVDKLGVLA